MTILTLASSASADPSIQDRRAQAEAVLGQIRDLDSRLAQTVESWNLATIKLNGIDGELTSNARHLVVAKKSLGIAQANIAARLRTLYLEGGSGGVMEVLLGAQSLDDLLGRLDVVQRVGRQDTTLLHDVKTFRSEVVKRRGNLKRARSAQADLVAERAAQKQWIEGQIAERQRLVASIRDEIARLEAAERRRQAILAAQARQRLLAQRAAEAARAAAAQAAARQPAQESTYQALEESSTELTAPGQSYAASDTEDAAAAAPVAPPASGVGSQAVAIAMQYLGVPYVWGGESPSGFDCSGLTTYAYRQLGISLPHHAASQYNVGSYVSRDALAPGDLVFFDGLGHMGMYIGGGQFIHAPHTGDVVKISSLGESWYASRYVGARRVA